MYFIRIQDHEGYEELIKEFFADYQDVLAVRHGGRNEDNPHFHIAIKTNLKRPALRARLVKKFDKDKGNQHMSIKPIANEEEYEVACGYGYHELFGPKGSNFWFKEILGAKDLQERSRERARVYYEKHGSKGGSRNADGAKHRRLTFTEEVVEGAIAEFMSGGLLKEGVNKDKVLRYIIKKFGTNRKVFDKFVINRVYNVVAWWVLGKQFESDFIDEVKML